MFPSLFLKERDLVTGKLEPTGKSSIDFLASGLSAKW